jgi:dihydrodipicolinate synthase/N-acetylneuraminate lyase
LETDDLLVAEIRQFGDIWPTARPRRIIAKMTTPPKITATEITAQEIIANPLARYPAATVACFDATMGPLPRRQLAPEHNKVFLERLAAAGVPAVLIAASTGHGHLRTVAELEEWFRDSAAAQLGGTVKMALLRPEDGIATNVRLLGLLAELDYPVVFVRPGRDLPADASDEQVTANMQPIVQEAARLGLAVGIYSIPDVSGVPLRPAAARLLVAGPGGENIVAVKVTEANYEQSTLRFLQDEKLAHLKIVQGWDPHLARALQEGRQFDVQGRQRCGVTSGAMSFALFQYLHMFDCVGRDWNELAAAQAAVSAIFAAMQDDPTKFADLQRAKYIMGLGQPLTGELKPAQVERVFTALEALPRAADRQRLARSLDLLETGPYHDRLRGLMA